jgi:hypothetical protein
MTNGSVHGFFVVHMVQQSGCPHNRPVPSVSAALTAKLPVGGSGASARVRQPASTSDGKGDEDEDDRCSLSVGSSGATGGILDIQCWGPPFWTGKPFTLQ